MGSELEEGYKLQIMYENGVVLLDKDVRFMIHNMGGDLT